MNGKYLSKNREQNSNVPFIFIESVFDTDFKFVLQENIIKCFSISLNNKKWNFVVTGFICKALFTPQDH